jgi:hypothetical protein
MRIKILNVIGLLAICAACSSTPTSRGPASEGLASPNENPAAGDTNFSSRNRRGAKSQSSGWGDGDCSPSTAAARIVSIAGGRTHSPHGCIGAVRDAYAGCSKAGWINTNSGGLSGMADHGWSCTQSSNPFGAPEGVPIVESRHVEIRVGNCFYADFHDPECKPATKYRHNPRHMYGWCTP